MIRYTLSCDRDHSFESWFQSSEAFDALSAAGRIACAVCGSVRVSKALMAPAVRGGRDEPAPLRAPASEIEAKLAELRRHIEENSEYVGLNFAAEARAIHEGDAPSRAIYGEAHRDEAKKLIEDGVPVAPLPFLPARRTN
jgi:hypothetical protein